MQSAGPWLFPQGSARSAQSARLGYPATSASNRGAEAMVRVNESHQDSAEPSRPSAPRLGMGSAPPGAPLDLHGRPGSVRPAVHPVPAAPGQDGRSLGRARDSHRASAESPLPRQARPGLDLLAQPAPPGPQCPAAAAPCEPWGRPVGQAGSARLGEWQPLAPRARGGPSRWVERWRCRDPTGSAQIAAHLTPATLARAVRQAVPAKGSDQSPS